MNKFLRPLTVLACLIAGGSLLGQSVTGTWKTVDDRSGEARALVRLYEKGGRLYGTIESLLRDGDKDARCTACKGDRKNKPVKGMQILNGLEKVGPYRWEGDGDSLFDPEQGKSFRSRVWLDPDHPDILKVRGYWMFFYRTQNWKRAS